MKNITELTGHLGTIARLADRAVKFADSVRAERDLYRRALQDIREGERL